MATAITQQVRTLVGSKVDALERSLVAHLADGPDVLREAGRNVFESGGKRLRPYLHLLSAELCGYRGGDDVVCATIIEYIHVASLLHDDVIDEAVLRRGRPTLNQKLGESLTVLVGDYLAMKAQGLAVGLGDLRIAELVSRTTLELVSGETLQEHWKGRLDVSEEEYLHVVDLKTGRLLAGSCEAAAVLVGDEVGEPRRVALREFGRQLGIAFQLIDDILDFESDERTLGKPVLSDLREGTVTLPAIHAQHEGGADARRLIARVVEDGSFTRSTVDDVLALVRETGGLEAARRRAREATARAREALSPFPASLPKQALLFAADFALGRRF